jgi:cytochrome c oxidase subunit 1
VASLGSYLIAISFLFFLWNIWTSWRHPVAAGANPWDAHTLEWFTSSPPPHHNYLKLPPVRSERPTWDYFHPDARTISHNGRRNGHVKVGAEVGSTGGSDQ